MALVLVEQRATTAPEISSRAYVLEQGPIVVQGLSAAFRVDDRVRKAYLGVEIAAVVCWNMYEAD